jgi:hypothetical protein
MISWNPYKRRARRNGVLVRIEFVDCVRARNPAATDLSDPTLVPSAVDFILVGRHPCRVVGPPVHMQDRVGHWRMVCVCVCARARALYYIPQEYDQGGELGFRP